MELLAGAVRIYRGTARAVDFLTDEFNSVFESRKRSGGCLTDIAMSASNQLDGHLTGEGKGHEGRVLECYCFG